MGLFTSSNPNEVTTKKTIPQQQRILCAWSAISILGSIPVFDELMMTRRLCRYWTWMRGQGWESAPAKTHITRSTRQRDSNRISLLLTPFFYLCPDPRPVQPPGQINHLLGIQVQHHPPPSAGSPTTPQSSWVFAKGILKGGLSMESIPSWVGT